MAKAKTKPKRDDAPANEPTKNSVTAKAASSATQVAELLAETAEHGVSIFDIEPDGKVVSRKEEQRVALPKFGGCRILPG